MLLSASRKTVAPVEKPEQRKRHPDAVLADRLAEEYVKSGKSPDNYGPAFEGCLGFVKLTVISLRASAGLPFSIDELVSAGSKGLAAGLEKYAPVEGTPASVYLGIKIRGAVFDWLRKENPIPQAAYLQGARRVALSEAGQLASEDDPETLVMRKRTLEWAYTNPALTSREKEVLLYEALAGLNQVEIGQVLGLKKPTICRIRAEAIRKLRAQLESEPSIEGSPDPKSL